ncbi:MAG: putative toxin-antitoxin system toxin component, PIN family [Fimbriimonadales bacterium]|nr:putative toxin-antitoxin system toxin component, PIN family [Fimbriimonadales bacterium]
MRAVIDTNIWVSALLNPSGYPARLLEAYRQQRFIVVLSRALMDELIAVLQRPRLTKRFQIQPEDVHELTALLQARSLWVEIRGELRLCRDPRDNLVLETAIQGQAQFLVSRDDDLKRDLALIEHLQSHGVRIVSVQQFLNILESEQGLAT